MPLTPADIHNVTFKKSALGRRGYDGEQVDALLDTVTLEMIELLEENESLRERARRGAAPDADPAPGGSTATELSTAHDMLGQARLACERAERNARELRDRLDHARQAARTKVTVDRPATAASGILPLAERAADQRARDARQEADALLLDAREESERITAEARSVVRDIAEDSRRRDEEAATALRRRLAALTREVDELSGFAGNYRTALRDHVRHQGEL